jgi:hypothetical protein
VCVLLLWCDFGVVCECVSQKAERNFSFHFWSGAILHFISFGGKQLILISEAAAGRGRRRRSAPRAPQATPTALRCTRPRLNSSAGSPLCTCAKYNTLCYFMVKRLKFSLLATGISNTPIGRQMSGFVLGNVLRRRNASRRHQTRLFCDEFYHRPDLTLKVTDFKSPEHSRVWCLSRLIWPF